ncbi:hypothetical protein JCM10450v2_000775 [Rhodotorula kratochvilovae]
MELRAPPHRIDTAAHPQRRPSSRLPRRPRRHTLTGVDDGASPSSAARDEACFAALGIALARTSGWEDAAGALALGRRDPSGGSASSLLGNASDSAYGTLDELDSARDDDDEEACELDALSPTSERGPEWRERVEATFTARSRRRVQAAVGADGWRLRTSSGAGDGLYWRRTLDQRCEPAGVDGTARTSPDVAQEPVFTFDVAYDADSSFESLDSLYPLGSTLPSASTSLCSSRSSPEPSECGESDSAATRLSMAHKRRRLLQVGGETAEELGASFLARRHTLPRRNRTREPGRKVSLVSLKGARRASALSSVEELAPPPSSLPSPTSSSPFPPLSRAVVIATCVVSLASLVSPAPLVVPLSPVHLRHAASAVDLALQVANAALAPFLVQPTVPSLTLSVLNLHLMRALDVSTSSTSSRAKGAVVAAVWAAIVSMRCLASWVFGRVLGWAHPQFLSARAIHEVGAGLAPLLLALYLIDLASCRRKDALPASVPALLAASFLVPAAHGGAGLWLGFCAVLVGLVASVGIAAWHALSTFSAHRPPASDAPIPATRTSSSISHFLAILLLPTLALYPASAPPTPAQTDLAFSQLHASHPTLLTVLLMTAPRPGNPDFLLQTIDSWLGAFPDPDPALPSSSTSLAANSSSLLPSAPPTSSRLRLVVYTHFATHAQFDLARAHFASSAKAAHYISWARDPRALAPGAEDRLDQRLHVARGLAHAAQMGGAYVLLTEDDFPLCEDARAEGEGRSWRGAWEKLQAALVATNVRMPDGDALEDGGGDGAMGHCGLFLATGGSGLAIRTPLAARLPALLLGADDPDGSAREAAAARGEIRLRREGDGADTPDLVIQDCLRGRLPECAVCAPGVGGPEGSARRPSWREGERVGKSGLAGTERLLQRHLGYNASTLPGRMYGREEWACGWRQPFNGEPDVLTV